ncbi:hypothetical protein BC827DRAFT_265443 [Russula dissimulans]|nr:hypothetical protein BC827DRAFT_265443 [Russula dissimulans]
MSQQDDDGDINIEAGEREPLAGGHDDSPPPHPRPARSIHAMTRDEVRKGIANRVIHSRTYIFLYLGMTALSITTVVLSVRDGCPGLAFYVLEVIINSAMIAEVTIRFLAFGRQQFWKYPFNVFDLVVTVFCVLTLLVIIFAGCGATSKEEEIFDTLLLVTRNVLQFGRLANIVRQSGRSIFARPRPIDLSAARRAGVSLDMDLDLTDDEGDGLHTALHRDAVLFDAQGSQRPQQSGALSDMPRAAQAARERDEEDLWAELG